MPRTFLAVPLPAKVKIEIGQKMEELQDRLTGWDINWVAPENLHITLVFFGGVKEEEVEPLKAEIARAVSGFVPFKIETGKLSLKGRPLWLEVEQGRKELQRLAEILLRKLTLKGSLAEERGFHAHLTLGRVRRKGKSALPEVKKKFSWETDRLILYESTFQGGRRIYTEVESFPFIS